MNLSDEADRVISIEIDSVGSIEAMAEKLLDWDFEALDDYKSGSCLYYDNDYARCAEALVWASSNKVVPPFERLATPFGNLTVDIKGNRNKK